MDSNHQSLKSPEQKGVRDVKEPALKFISTLIWQGIIVFSLVIFGQEIQSLLKRIAHVKHGETEIVFQEPVLASEDTSSVTSPALELRDAEGFFTRHGVMELVNAFPGLNPGEKAQRALLVFATARQHTWLVATNRRVFYILDDENTRASKQLIQSEVALNGNLEVKTRSRSASATSFKIGSSGWWYYSAHRLGEPSAAENTIARFVNSDFDS